MDPRPSFGRWVKQQRKVLDITQHELAEQVGCALSTLQKIERDARKPSRQLAELLAHHLELDPSEYDAFLHLARSQPLPAPLALTVTSPTRPPMYNLPSPLTSLVGREWEVTTVCARLLEANVRLLTITGLPGMGKTRLSLQVAAQLSDSFADGVCFVALAPIADASFVTAAIGRALGIEDTGGRPLAERIKRYLRSQAVLLVLDNFEHVLAAAPLVGELLEAAAHLKILVTSRATLQVYGEHEFITPPLALPDLKQLPALHQLRQYAAVDLFVQRARAVQQEFTLSVTNAHTVAAICVRLDGMPLAIELAAARTKLFSPQALLTRLTDVLAQPLDLLADPHRLPERHRSLRSALVWSYKLLNPTEQIVFRGLGVFVGGCTLAALAAVVSQQLSVSSGQSSPSADHRSLNTGHWLPLTVYSLINQSLVIQQQEADSEPRFTLLEMLREYALEQLQEQDEALLAQRAHATYYWQLAEEYKKANFEGKSREAAVWSWVEREVNNLRTALRWATTHDPELELQITETMTHFWSTRRYLNEGRQWLEHFLARARTAPAEFLQQHQADLVELHAMLAFFTWSQGDYALAQTRLEESAALRRQLQQWEGVGWDLHFLALTFFYRGDFSSATAAATESVTIQRTLDKPGSLANALSSLGSVTAAVGDYTTARTLHEESMAIFRQLDNPWGVCLALLGLSEIDFAQGEDRRAAVGLEQALQHYREADEPWFAAYALLDLGKVRWRQGDATQATQLWQESIAFAHDVNARRFLAEASFMLGLAAQESEDRQQADARFRQSLALYQAMENQIGMAYALSGLASLAEQPIQQAQLLGAAATILDTARLPMDQIEHDHYERTVATVRAPLDEATFAVAWAQGQNMSLAEAVVWVAQSIIPCQSTSTDW